MMVRNQGLKRGFSASLRVLCILLALLSVMSVTACRRETEEDDANRAVEVLIESENFRVTVPMMSYLVATERSNLLQMLAQFGVSIKAGGGPGGSALDPELPLKDQIYSSETDADSGITVTRTWFDYFYDQVEADMIEVLACCEAARAEGIELSQDDRDHIEEQLNHIDVYASYLGYSLNKYYASLYGRGVTRADVQEAAELLRLAEKYTETLRERTETAITMDQIEEYYENNREDMDCYIGYVNYIFEAVYDPCDEDGYDAAYKKYTEQQERYNRYADLLRNCANKEEDLSLLYELILQDEQYKIIAGHGAGYTLTAEELAQCEAFAQTATEGAFVAEQDLRSGFSYGNGVHGWLSEKGHDPELDRMTYSRKVGDKCFTESVDEAWIGRDTAARSQYGLALVTAAPHRNEQTVRDAGHILIRFEEQTSKEVTGEGIKVEIVEGVITSPSVNDTISGNVIVTNPNVQIPNGGNSFVVVLPESGVGSGNNTLTTLTREEAEAKIAEILDEMRSKGLLTEVQKPDGSSCYTIDRATFERYGMQYTYDGNVFYEGVSRGEMVDTFDAWMFDDSRIEGEIGVVESGYGFHIMYYVGNEVESWIYEIRNILLEQSMNAHIEELSKGVDIVWHEDNKKEISL